VLYERLGQGELHGVGFLLAYPERPVPEPPAAAPAHRPPAPPPARAPLRRKLRLGFVGAGSYATSMLLPHLAGNEDVELARVATTTSLSAANAQRRFSFTDASTDTASVLDDESIDAVFIVTRHRTHADLTCQALERGKTVFVEKPLALSLDELDQVRKVIDATGNDRLMVGFNRRFAPMFVDLRSRFGAQGPSLVRYLVNAGRLDPKSWYGRTATEGSRFEGEGGHFIDTVSWWLDALPAEVHALATDDPDDLLVNLRFDDGSVASIAYATKGSSRFPKETFEASAGGRTARLANFRSATVWSGRRRKVNRSLGAIDKGQRAEVQAFVDAVRSGGPMPISLPSLVATTRATLAVSASRASRRPESVQPA
jgi:predicted dehydrogenase